MNSALVGGELVKWTYLVQILYLIARLHYIVQKVSHSYYIVAPKFEHCESVL
jgi:hypothetical protein